MKEDRELIGAWILAQKFGTESIEYEQVSWAAEMLIEMVHVDPEKLWHLLPKIIEADESDKTLGAIGAGLLEDLMVHHGEDFIDRVSSLAESNSKFKQAMQYTFLDREDVSSEVFEKFLESKLNNPRE